MLTGLLIIWALTAFELRVASVAVPGVRMHSTGGLWLAALVMALLGIVGFVLAEWLMLGAVNWMMMEHAHGRPPF